MKTRIYFLSFLIFILAAPFISGQSIRGSITDKNGEPVPFATIYLEELIKGTTANNEGDFDFTVPEGKYTIIIRALGYKPETRQVEVGNEMLSLDIILTDQIYEIDEVRVYVSGEDPAYGIMRKAIGLAPYYLNQIKQYTADVYLKGSIIVQRLPKFVIRAMEKDGEKLEVGMTYVEESLNEIKFTAPDQYEQRVISFNTSFPQENSVNVMGYISSSFYQPTVEMAISPLAPNAFSHYKFRYEGVSFEGKYAINKIRVIPRRKSQQLFSGYISIIDNLWSLHSVDLTIKTFIGPINIKQVQNPVKENVWLPVGYNLGVEASILGIKIDVKYLSSLKYSDIEINRDITPPLALQEIINEYNEPEEEQPVVEEENKTITKIDKILEKEELSNRDMYKLAKLMNKETEKEREKEVVSLEIVDKLNFTIEEDAYKKDTTYWETMRPIPLTGDEIMGYEFKDSLDLATSDGTSNADSVKTEISITFSIGKQVFSDKTFRSKDSSLVVRYYGLLRLNQLNFNTVDGWTYWQKLRIRKIFNPGKEISIYPEIGYAFNRSDIMWKVHNSITYSPLKRGRYFLDIGQISEDFNSEYGMSSNLNTMYSLFFRYNYMKFFQESYVRMGNRIDLANGLRFTSSIHYGNRISLVNSTDYSFFYKKERDFEPNIPDNPNMDLSSLQNQEAFSLHLGFEYTPKYFYRIRNGVKYMMNSDFPTFRIQYRKAIKGVFNSQANFDYLEAGISRNKDLGLFNDIFWSIRAGIFINNSNVHFADYRHFNTQNVPVVFDSFEDNFVLLDYYKYSTNEWFAEAHIKYNTPFFFIKLLPFFSDKLWLESLYAGYLHQPGLKNYVELGYGLSEVFFFSDISVFGGFENGKYKRTGLRIVLEF